jgi:hypothetical protein
MASTFSSDLKLELVATGEKAGLWGTITNTNLQILEQSASGYLDLSMASGSVTLLLSDGAASNGKNFYLKLSGNLSTNTTLTMPSGSERVWVISDETNRTSSKYTLSVTTGDEVSFLDARGTFASNNLIVDRNGQPINTGTSNLTISTAGQSFTLVYVDSTRGWAYKTNTA